MPTQFNSVTFGLKHNYFCLIALFFWHSPSPFFSFPSPLHVAWGYKGRHSVLTLWTASLGLGLHWLPPSVLDHVPTFSRTLLTVSLGHSWERKYNSPLFWRSSKLITHSHQPCNIGGYPKGEATWLQALLRNCASWLMALLHLSFFSAATGWILISFWEGNRLWHYYAPLCQRDINSFLWGC